MDTERELNVEVGAGAELDVSIGTDEDDDDVASGLGDMAPIEVGVPEPDRIGPGDVVVGMLLSEDEEGFELSDNEGRGGKRDDSEVC